jgi:hypothetical protein
MLAPHFTFASAKFGKGARFLDAFPFGKLTMDLAGVFN